MAAINVVPQANSRISDTQAPIVQNFTSIRDAFDLNHGEFGDATEGKHRFLQMPEQVAAPTTLANEAGLYAALGATSAVSELVFRRENDGAEIAFTEMNSAATGWTRLPSGLILKWGTTGDIASSAGDAAHLIAFNGPAFATATYSVTLGIQSANPASTNVYAIVERGSLTVNGFSLFMQKFNGANAVTFAVYYMAIGI